MKQLLCALTLLLSLNAMAQTKRLILTANGMPLKAPDIYEHLNDLKDVKGVQLEFAALSPKEKKILNTKWNQDVKRYEKVETEIKNLRQNFIIVQDQSAKADKIFQAKKQALENKKNAISKDIASSVDELMYKAGTKKEYFAKGNIHELESKLNSLLKNKNEIVVVSVEKSLSKTALKYAKKSLSSLGVILTVLSASKAFAGEGQSSKSAARFDSNRHPSSDKVDVAVSSKKIKATNVKVQ